MKIPNSIEMPASTPKPSSSDSSRSLRTFGRRRLALVRPRRGPGASATVPDASVRVGM